MKATINRLSHCRSACRAAAALALALVIAMTSAHSASHAEPAPNAGAAGVQTPAPPPAAAMPSAAVAPQTATPAAIGGHQLPSDLSPWTMFLAADIIVKIVMVGLAAASFLVWTIWVAKTAQIFFGQRRLARDLAAISGRTSLADAEASVAARPSLAARMIREARSEAGPEREIFRSGAPDRIHSRLGEIEARVARDIRSGMSTLATVGATGPFIGLFGTVWGIMNSFIGISKSHTTNLAVVAPGIAEALLATAVGLVAAIPAVILYNNLGKGIAGYRRAVRETKGEVERIVSRQMETRPVAQGTHKFPGLASAAE